MSCFITFEGVEGSGKTTQIQLAKDYFESRGREVLTTVEPGGTALGKKIRELLLDPDTELHHKYTELFLFTADRLEHVSQCIMPALLAGKIVLCDRYIDSTIAYQHGGRGVAKELVMQFVTMMNCMPDKTILFDIDPEQSLKRAKARATLDRFENEDMDFHRRIRASYLQEADEHPNRFEVIDKSIDGRIYF